MPLAKTILWRSLQAGLLFALSVQAGLGSGPSAGSRPDEPALPSRSALPVLTTARQAHSLTPQEAARAFPVRLRGVVTYFDPWQAGHKALFIADSTGSIFIAPGDAILPPLHTGSIVAIEGVTDPGGFAPIIANPRIQLLPGIGQLPRPLRVDLPTLLTGAEDGQWVEMEGVIHSIDVDGKHVVFTLATQDGKISATSIREDDANYSALVDSTVRLRGIAAPLVDTERRMIGARILFPGLSAVSVISPAPSAPFSLPVRHLAQLFQYASATSGPHRIHIRGSVTLDWPGSRVCIAEGGDGLCMQTRETAQLREGQIVDAVGFLERENYVPTLEDAVLRPGGIGAATPPVRLSAEDAFRGDHNGQLVQIAGTLVAKNEAGANSELLLSAGNLVFPALLPPESGPAGRTLRPDWKVGSRIVLTGVFSGNVDAHLVTRREGISQIDSFQILMRSPSDLDVLELPSWWNARHAAGVLAGVGFVIAAILFWVAALRRQVQRQTVIIRRSAEQFRHMAEHDPLTGLSVRTVFFERLALTLEEARIRSGTFALMMIDLDGFKQLNDSLGHAAGDAVLCAIAQRLEAGVRKTDTVARVGGDEFMVLLPGAHGNAEAVTIAAHLLNAVSAPLILPEGPVTLSVSIGVTTFPEGGRDGNALCKAADQALYSAKSMGRNCFQTFPAAGSAALPLKGRIQPA